MEADIRWPPTRLTGFTHPFRYIYIHQIFSEVESRHQTAPLSFVDDVGFLVKGNSLNEIRFQLEKVAAIVLAVGESHKVEFETAKTEVVLLTRSRKTQRRALDCPINVGGTSVSFKREATRWLGLWLDSSLNFKEHWKLKQKKDVGARRKQAELLTVGMDRPDRPGFLSTEPDRQDWRYRERIF